MFHAHVQDSVSISKGIGFVIGIWFVCLMTLSSKFKYRCWVSVCVDPENTAGLCVGSVMGSWRSLLGESGFLTRWFFFDLVALDDPELPGLPDAAGVE